MDRPAPNGSALFFPFRLRGAALKNRIAVSPMCRYCAAGGMSTEWHLAHLGGRAVGGAALVMTEAIVAAGMADIVLLARELLRDPYRPPRAARVPGADIPWPPQYERARPG